MQDMRITRIKKTILFCLAFTLVMLSAFSTGAEEPEGSVYYVNRAHPAASDDNPGTSQAPWETISRAAKTLEPGDTVIIHGGIYRESVRPENSGRQGEMISYRAAPGEEVVIKGSKVIEGWIEEDGLWYAHWPHSESRFRGYRDNFRYRYEQVFWNGDLLFHSPDKQFLRSFAQEAGALTTLLNSREEVFRFARNRTMEELRAAILFFYGDGSFTIDYTRHRIYVKLPEGVDPNSREVTLEGSVESVLFDGRGKNHIGVYGITFVHCAQPHFQHGSVHAGNGWVLEDLDVLYSAGRGVSLAGAQLVRGVRSNYHASLGFGGRAELVEDCETSYNNYKAGDWITAENGGWKSVYADGMTVIGHLARGNFGPGIWLDIDNRNSTITRSRAEKNTGPGIFVEISGIAGIFIHDNLSVFNGLESFSSWGDAGILLAESENCIVRNNIVAGNREGIAIRMQGPRTLQTLPLQGSRFEISHYTRNHVIYDNIVAHNRDYQLAFWGDNHFFGYHPNREVAEREMAGRKPSLNPEELNIMINHNIYFSHGDGDIFLYGASWRPQSKTYSDLDTWKSERIFDSDSIFADPMFADWQKGDFRLMQESPALKAGIGLRRPAREMGGLVYAE